MALFGKKKDDDNIGLYQSDYQKYSLEPLQQINYENVPKDANGIPFGIIARTTVTVDGDNYAVDVYNDTEHNEGTCVLPNGNKGKVPEEAYRKFLDAFDEEMNRAKHEEVTGKAAPQGKDAKKMTKAEKAEAKRRAKIDEETNATTQDYKKDKNKKTLALVIYIVAVLVVVLFAKFIVDAQQDTVDVIRLKADLLSGDVITSEHIEPYSMLESTYETLGRSTYMSDGKTVTTQTMLTWDKAEEVLGKYMTCYTQAGQILTSRHVTDETTTRNPWLAVATAGQEVYTMAFNANDVNTSLLYPGCHMRVRLVVNMQYDEYQQYINSQGSSSIVVPEGSDETVESGSLSVLLNMAETIDGVNVINQETIVEHASEVPVVEVVFNDLQAIDMINGQNQSIYELYMALLKLPLDERVEYLNTRLENNDTANNFRSLVTPTRLVFLLSKEQANMLAQFENVGDANFKFTILLTEDEDDKIVSSFIDISSQLQNALEKNS